MYLFFDTETNGLPKDPNAPMSNNNDWPRITQLAFAYYNKKGILIDKECDLIKPDGWTIPELPFFIEHGYTTENSLKNGIPLIDSINKMLPYIEKCRYIIAHNMIFDYNVLGSEMMRLGIKCKNKPVKFCTKECSIEYCAIPSTNDFYRSMGKYKWPNLTELHNKLFGKDFEGAHDAMNDVMAMKDCFFEMLKREIIVL